MDSDAHHVVRSLARVDDPRMRYLITMMVDVMAEQFSSLQAQRLKPAIARSAAKR
jgi:hypothetical protein